MFDKFKHLLADDALFYGALIVLCALISFGLGRWSVLAKTGDAPLKAQQGALLPQTVMQTAAFSGNAAPVASSTARNSEQYVASKNGTKYHLISCPGAAQIKDANKIYFATKEAAEKAGYTAASNCPGI